MARRIYDIEPCTKTTRTTASRRAPTHGAARSRLLRLPQGAHQACAQRVVRSMASVSAAGPACATFFLRQAIDSDQY